MIIKGLCLEGGYGLAGDLEINFGDNFKDRGLY